MHCTLDLSFHSPFLAVLHVFSDHAAYALKVPAGWVVSLFQKLLDLFSWPDRLGYFLSQCRITIR